MAHLAAVAHYTNLARQAAALQSAQVAYDNRAEPEQATAVTSATDLGAPASRHGT